MTGLSTKLKRRPKKIGRREELFSSAKSIINPLSNQDNAMINTDLTLALILISICSSLKGWQKVGVIYRQNVASADIKNYSGKIKNTQEL